MTSGYKAPTRLRMIWWFGPALTLLGLAGVAKADDLPVPASLLPAISHHLLDQAAILEPKLASTLSDWMEAHQKSIGDQVLLVTLGDLKGRSAKAWSIAFLDRAIAEDARTLVIVVAPNQEEAAVAVSDQFSPEIANEASGIVRGDIGPDFSPARLQADALRCVSDMLDVLSGKATGSPKHADQVGSATSWSMVNTAWAIGVGALLLYVVGVISSGLRRRKLGTRRGGYHDWDDGDDGQNQFH